jgi:hypothetical protein
LGVAIVSQFQECRRFDGAPGVSAGARLRWSGLAGRRAAGVNRGEGTPRIYFTGLSLNGAVSFFLKAGGLRKETGLFQVLEFFAIEFVVRHAPGIYGICRGLAYGKADMSWSRIICFAVVVDGSFMFRVRGQGFGYPWYLLRA